MGHVESHYSIHHDKISKKGKLEEILVDLSETKVGLCNLCEIEGYGDRRREQYSHKYFIGCAHLICGRHLRELKISVKEQELTCQSCPTCRHEFKFAKLIH